MKKAIVVFSSLIWGLALIALPAVVGAQSNNPLGLESTTAVSVDEQDPFATASNLIRLVLGILGIIALIIMVYAGIIWMTAAGDDNQVAKAKKLLYTGLAGLIIILSGFALSQFIINQLLLVSSAI